MRRSLILFILAAFLLPSVCAAQKTDPAPTDVKNEEKRKKEEEEMRKALAEAEAMRKKAEAEEAARKKAFDERKKKMAELKAESSGAGFKLLKIPVAGGYYLGMLQSEFDSLLKIEPLTLTTDLGNYVFTLEPHYYKDRLYMLNLALPDSLFASNMPDITAYYMNKLGMPDEEMNRDSVMVFPSDADVSLTGEYRVKETRMKWHFNYHDIIIGCRFIDMKNGIWKGYYHFQYSGTVEFVKNLVKLPGKE